MALLGEVAKESAVSERQAIASLTPSAPPLPLPHHPLPPACPFPTSGSRSSVCRIHIWATRRCVPQAGLGGPIVASVLTHRCLTALTPPQADKEKRESEHQRDLEKLRADVLKAKEERESLKKANRALQVSE